MTPGDPRSVVTPDGRTLAGRVLGPPDGTPVLFVAGAGTGSSMAFGGDLLPGAGVRLLTVDRPGMGGSDPDDARTLASTVADYRAFVEGVLGEPGARVPVVANSQGAVFGLGAAVAGWASRLVLVSPADEVADPRVRALLPDGPRELSELASAHPERAAAVLRGFTAEAMAEMVLAGSGAADRACYTEPEFRRVYRQALAEGFAHGGRGYVLDTLIAMRPWGLALDAVACPVHVLVGADDLGHSPDRAATLTGRIPGARREVVDGAGGALLWTHPERVLAALLGEPAVP